MKRNIATIFFCVVSVTAISLLSLNAIAANHMASDRISDIRNTKHNFASGDMPDLPGGGSRAVQATSENQVCVFCHTPHGDPDAAIPQTKDFLWSRKDSAATYTEHYTSSSLNVVSGAALGKGTKMCLSCHDGTVAIGQVYMTGGVTERTIDMTGVKTDLTMADGTDGHTSNLGISFKNDHPVGFVYSQVKAAEDGELADPDTESYIGIRVGSGVANFNQNLVDGGGAAGADNPTSATTRIAVPLESAAEAAPGPFIKVATSGSVECTTCHDPHIRSTDNTENIKFLRLHRFQKQDPIVDGQFNINGDINCLACHKKKGWAGSAHASESAGANTINTTTISNREFPTGIKVWEASCLSCHDTHTVTGASHLLVKAATVTSSDVEQTCYQCHGNTSILEGAEPAANIEEVASSNPHGFTALISDNFSQHDILSGDFDESVANLKTTNRHTTCTDCHNPHRTQHYTKYDVNDGVDADNTSALHKHEEGIIHSNIASGALSGISGVEPNFDGGLATFDPYATSTGDTYTVLKGDASAATPVTKEYQVCLKCHSEAGATIGNPVVPGNTANTAVEFSTTLAKSYHPVIQSTDDNPNVDKAIKSATANVNYLSPFGQGKGVQTMYCSDCHANDNVSQAKGPHGSNVAGLLKASGDALCASCHDANQYQTFSPTTTSTNSGFSCANSTGCVVPTANSNSNNLHVFHASAAGNKDGIDADNICADCHVKVPHGWRNKALLADLGDADVEGLQARYYPDAKITIIDPTPASSTWEKTDCTNATCHLP
ncbi:MAG: cytochrome c3 family protein [Gammaproteobacteria bacterium]|nr:cytochrome c3 family protein [Gammaproteobacteria bacterium]